MSAEGLKSAKYYARMICMHMKSLPDHYAESPKDVQDSLGLTDAEFKLGLDFCVARKVITLEAAKAEKPAASASPFVEEETAETEAVKEPASTSPFLDDEEEETVAAEAVAEPAVAAAGKW